MNWSRNRCSRNCIQGLFIKGWGYNGSSPGPTIKAYPDDYVNIRVYNCLPEPTSVHWHGMDVPRQEFEDARQVLA